MSDPITTAEETLERYDNLTNANGYGAGDHRRLAAALRSLIEHAKASDAARDEVQEKIAYLRRNCMNLPEQELRQKISAVDSAEWRLGYYWNTLVAEHRDRATRAEYAQREAESERDALQARIDELVNALADVVARAIPYGDDEDGFIMHYLSGTGAIHAAIPLLDRYGITVRPGAFDSRKAGQ